MNDIGSVFLTGFGLVAGWLLFYFGLRPYRIDRVRMELFKLRNELFLYAAEGNISFDDPAYCWTRKRINAMIRYAHTITLSRALIFMVADRFVPNCAEDLNKKWLEARSRLPQPAQGKIKNISQRMTIILSWQVITGAPLLFIIIAIWVPFIKAAQYLRRDPRESMNLRVANELRVELIEDQAMLAQSQQLKVRDYELVHG